MKRCIALVLILFFLATPTISNAEVSIVISSHERQMPIAISDFSGTHGKELSDVIADDLRYTGLFLVLEKDAFIEKPEQAFRRENWSVIQADVVLKGNVEVGENISVNISLYDVSDGTEILIKKYEAGSALLRQIGHSIANDIYMKITGNAGVFRTKIAFIVRGDSGKELYLMDWDGQRIKRLGFIAPVIVSPRWSRDGLGLLYSAQRDGRWGIYILTLSEAKERLIHSSKAMLMAGDITGNEIIFSSSQKGTPDIYLYEITRNETRNLTSMRGIEVSPSFSPDAETIAFVSDMGGSPQVYTMDKNGYNINRVTFEGSYNTSPSWSPSGDKIAFVGEYKGKNQIFLVSPNGFDQKRLTEHGNNEDPSFSPDGRFITFTSDRDGEKTIYIMRADGEEQKRITPKGLKASGPRWSPN
ncbi:MAG: Tol-Pal system beta propeller repeat protein TolB [Nitrospirae bacterium]|nr:Tol-Pal system beta propeller repeat protein TolB [Nitrospirota bacterium]